MNSIGLTIPLEYNALNRAADMLHGMAEDLKGSDIDTFQKAVIEQVSNTTNIPIESLVDEIDEFHALSKKEVNQTNFGPVLTDKPDHNNLFEGTTIKENLENVNTGENNSFDEFEKAVMKQISDTTKIPIDLLTNEIESNKEQPPMVHPGVELDSAGLPYDARIHTKGKLKKTKKDGKWKYARNIEPELIKTVETELRAAMAASPENPIIDVNKEKEVNKILEQNGVKSITDNVAPAAPVDTPVTDIDVIEPPSEMYLLDGKEYTAEQLYSAGWTDQQMLPLLVNNKSVSNMTFPEFMAKITPALGAGTITQDNINSVLNIQGLASLPLLSARPDLISAIHSQLFPS